MLTSRSQKALTVNTNTTASAVRHNAAETHTIVSGVQNDVVNTRAIVSDSHRNVLESPEDTRSQNRMVSTIRTLPVFEQPLIPA